MSNLKINSISIENFMGTKERAVIFGNRTDIRGRNGIGKTTIANAFCWLLNNKMLDGKQADNIRPKVDGVAQNGLEIRVVLEVEIDGVPFRVEKVQKQKYNKKLDEWSGNNNSYFINDVPKKEKDFLEFVKSKITEGNISFMVAPSAFLNLDNKSRRATIMALDNTVTDDLIIDLEPRFDTLRADLKQFTTDELISACKHRLNGQGRSRGGLVAKRDEIPTRIDEISKGIKDIKPLQAEIDEGNRGIDTINESIKNLEDVTGSTSTIQSEITELRFKLNDIETASNRGNAEKRIKLNDDLLILRDGLSRLDRIIRHKKDEINSISCEIISVKEKIQKERETFNAFKESEFTEPMRRYLSFDESETICPCCGRIFNADKIAEIRERFEKSKADEEEQIRKSRELFEKEKEAIIACADIGNALINKKNELEESKKSCEQSLKNLEADRKKQEEEIVRITEEVDAIPFKVDMAENEEYQKTVSEIASKERVIEELKEDFESFKEAKERLEAERGEIQKRIAELEAKIENIKVSESRVADLRNEQVTLSQMICDEEARIELIKDFRMKKCEMLTDKINSKFQFIKWELFKQLQNGDVTEICEPTYNGIAYGSTLNTAYKILLDFDMVNAFQSQGNTSLPVFIDCAESLDKSTRGLIETDKQIVYLSVTDGEFEVLID